MILKGNRTGFDGGNGRGGANRADIVNHGLGFVQFSVTDIWARLTVTELPGSCRNRVCKRHCDNSGDSGVTFIDDIDNRLCAFQYLQQADNDTVESGIVDHQVSILVGELLRQVI